MVSNRPQSAPEDKPHNLSEKHESSFDSSEKLLKEGLRHEVRQELSGLGETIESEEEQREVEELKKEFQLSPEEHVGRLAEATLGAEWNQRRTDGRIAQKEVDAVLRETLAEMQKRGLGFERSPFRI